MEMTNKILKIKNEYIGEDCVQVMIPYKDSLTLLNKDIVLYHYQKESPLYINKYVFDERKEQFPYNNIPVHFENINFEKYTYTNQILNFDEPYIRIVDGIVTENYVVKDNDEALLFKKTLDLNKKTEYKTRDELEKMFSVNEDENLYAMSLDGKMYGINNILYPTEEEMVEKVKERMNDELNNYSKTLSYSVKCFSDDTIDFFKDTINNMNVDNIATNVDLIDSDDLLLIRTNGKEIKIKIVNIKFIGKDNYKVITVDAPVNIYTLEQLRILVPNVTKIKNPKISLRLNKNINKDEIVKAKQMVKTLR